MPNNQHHPETLARALTELEVELEVLGARWRQQFAETRRSRLLFRSLCAMVGEKGRDLLQADPERARTYLGSAERMGAACRAIDAAAAIAAAMPVDFGEPSSKQMAEAVVEWRKRLDARIAESLTPSPPTMPEEAPQLPEPEPPRRRWPF